MTPDHKGDKFLIPTVNWDRLVTDITTHLSTGDVWVSKCYVHHLYMLCEQVKLND